ncbi:hypothetical protein GH714_016845 [Hevea brasiliensis]|uniref:Uncharacterized protein n=1 Tax=Hevea brasiliensis TaxID=3981 RepID=A0A6A6KEA5_HEVBR|nr:hypothetical protein GH714_016845 [Hevea brasiliensis]
MVDGMDFGELCNEYECISSPLVDQTTSDMDSNFRCDFLTFVLPVVNWKSYFLSNCRIQSGVLQSVQEMDMLSTSVLHHLELRHSSGHRDACSLQLRMENFVKNLSSHLPTQKKTYLDASGDPIKVSFTTI